MAFADVRRRRSRPAFPVNRKSSVTWWTEKTGVTRLGRRRPLRLHGSGSNTQFDLPMGPGRPVGVVDGDFFTLHRRSPARPKHLYTAASRFRRPRHSRRGPARSLTARARRPASAPIYPHLCPSSLYRCLMNGTSAALYVPPGAAC